MENLDSFIIKGRASGEDDAKNPNKIMNDQNIVS